MNAPTVEVICGDALEELRKLPEASVDALVTDPPYGEGAAAWDRTSADWHGEWLGGVMRVLKPDAPMLIFQSRRLGWQVDTALVTLNIPIRGQLIWWHGQGFAPAAGHPRIVHEPIRWAGGRTLRADAPEVRKGQEYVTPHPLVKRQSEAFGFKEWTYTPHPDGPLASTVFRGARNGEDRSGHPTQKPLELMRWLVRLACPDGGKILDCFAGSGSTLVACLETGRRCIGIEREQKYVDIIHRRLDGLSVPLPLHEGESA